MSQGRGKRLLAVLTALGFAGATVNPHALDPCPIHSPEMVHCMSAHTDCPPGGMSHDADHAGHNHHGHTCCCVGACCCTSAPTVTPTRLVALPVVPVAIARTVISTDRALPPAAPYYRLPPPLGPPAFHV
jgi:hypothetical protein